MLVKLRFYFPEVFLGALLAVAIFAMGAAFSSRNHPSDTIAAQHAPTKNSDGQPNEGLWNWLSHDATGFFTLGLLLVGSFQIGLFLRQLRFIRDSLDDAKKAADAATEGAAAAKQAANAASIQAEAIIKAERPYIFVFDVKILTFDTESREFFVEYSVANYGKIPAVIESPHIGFEFSDKGEPPLPSLMLDSHALLVSPILQSGEKREKIREYLPTGMAAPEIIVDVETGVISPTFQVPKNSDVFFRAVIQYRGPFSKGHETGALWLVNYPSLGQLAQRGGEQYNYVK